MCAALAEAHQLGIVHRDIKPQNILFGSVGANQLPKLADFGIAKWSADDEAGREQRAEDTAIVAGQKLAMYSPSWAAPEQLAGQPVSPATDIYSLAVVAVYMLSGKAIFADEDVYAGYKKRRHADDLVRDTLLPVGRTARPRQRARTRARVRSEEADRCASTSCRPSCSGAVDPSTEEVSRITTPGKRVTPSQPPTPTIPHAAITPPTPTPRRAPCRDVRRATA